MLSLAAEALWTARYDYAPGWSLVPHSHVYFQMLHVLAGQGVIHVGERTLALGPGLTVLLKPGVVHGLIAETEVRTLDVKFNLLSPVLKQYLLSAPDHKHISGDVLPVLFDRLRSEGEMRAGYYQDMCDLHLCHVLLLYLREAEEPVPVQRSTSAVFGETDDLIRQALAIIRKRYDSDLTVRGIARMLGCSERTLRHHFVRVLGLRPLTYLQRFRVDRAKELIQYSDLTLKEISGTTGFKTVQHFSRLFSQFTGESPASWRDTIRAGIRKDVVIRPNFSNKKWTIFGRDLPSQSRRRKVG